MSLQCAASLLLLLCAVVVAEVVQFRPCPAPSEDEPASNCTVHEVRISPCTEAAQKLPCKIKRGHMASIQFDYTPDVSTNNITGRAYWASEVADLPFVGMDINACNYTSCPMQSGNRQTYEYRLPISKKFPLRVFDVKWKLFKEEGDAVECCFITKIKLIR